MTIKIYIATNGHNSNDKTLTHTVYTHTHTNHKHYHIILMSGGAIIKVCMQAIMAPTIKEDEYGYYTYT